MVSIEQYDLFQLVFVRLTWNLEEDVVRLVLVRDEEQEDALEELLPLQRLHAHVQEDAEEHWVAIQ